MNHIYKSIFNKALGVFTAVPEFASAHGKGSERTVVGRVAKGTAGFAASALAISIGLALTSTSAMAGAGIYINDGADNGCIAVPDAAPPYVGLYGISNGAMYPAASILGPGQQLPPISFAGLDVMKPCLSSGANATAVEKYDSQTNRTLFYGKNAPASVNDNGAKNLTLGGRLDVNSGIIGVGDRGTNGTDATNSIRMGTGTTLDDANKQWNAISIGTDAGVNTASSVAIGYNAKAGQADKFQGQGAVALGYNAQALGTSAISIGEDSSATNGHNGVAIGAYSKTSNEKAISIGAFNTASGAQSIVMAGNYDTNSRGPVSVASGTRATVIGAETTVSGNNSLAIGDTNTVASDRTYTIGNNINVAAGADDSLAFGTKAGVGGPNAIALGNTAKASAANTVAISNQAQAKTPYSVALGASAVAGDDSTGALNGGEAAIAIGRQAVANVYNGIAIGKQATIKKDSADGIAIGAETKVNAYKGAAIGAFSEANGSQALAIGNNKQGQSSVASGERSQVIGVESNVSGQDSTAIGYKNTVASNRTYAIGNNINAAAGTRDSLAFGTRASVGGASSIALGSNTKTYTDDSISIGSFSESGGPATTANLLGTKAIAIGYETKALATSAVALGYGATVENGHDSIAIGVKAKTSTQKSTTIGSYSEASGDQSTVIANNYDSKAGKAVSTASGTRSQVYGAETNVSGNNSVAIGDTNTVASSRTYAIGNNINVAAGASDSLVFGTKASVGGPEAIALGNTANSKTDGAISIGAHTVSGDGDLVAGVEGNKSISIGYESIANRYNTIAMGVQASTQAADSGVAPWDAVAIGSKSKATTYKALAIGAYSQATGRQSTVIGNDIQGQNSTASGERSQILGVQSNVSGDNSVSIGDTNNVAAARTYVMGNNINVDNDKAVDSLAFGTQAKVAGINTIAMGTQSEAAKNYAIAIGAMAKSRDFSTVALGSNSDAVNASAIAVGNESNAIAQSSTAIGFRAKAQGYEQVSIGSNAGNSSPVNAENYGAVFIGRHAGSGNNSATGNTDGVSIGSNAGQNAVSGIKNIAVGPSAGQSVEGSQNLALSFNAGSSVKGDNNLAMMVGAGNNIEGGNNIAIGTNANSGTPTAKRVVTNSIAMGANTQATSNNTIAIGPQARALAANAVALGVGSLSNKDNSVALGAYSATSDIHTGDYTLNNSYTAAGLPNAANGTVSVGAVGKERQIQNVAAGVISATSTDAINGSQLYATNNYMNNFAGDVKTKLGGNAALGTDGHLTMTNIGGTGENTVDDAIKNLKTSIDNKADTTASVTSENQADIKVDKEAPVGNTTNYKLSLGDDAKAKLAKAATALQTVEGDSNITATKDATDPTKVKLALNKNLTADSVTLGDKAGDHAVVNKDGLTIANGPSVKKDGINAGNKKITGVANGNVATGSTDAVNGGQLAEVKSKADSAVQNVVSANPTALTATKAGDTVTLTPNVIAGDLVNPATGAVNTPAAGDAGKLVTAGTVANALANTHFVVDTAKTDGELDAASKHDQKIKSGNKVTLQAGKNLKAKQTNAADGATVEFSLKDSISLTQVTAGTGDNQVVLGNDGVQVGGNTYINKDGLNANNKVISNVANGVAPTDAVNKGQLDAVKNVADSAVQSVDVVANENNLVVDNTDPKNPKLRLRKAVDLDSIKLENNVGEKSFLNSAGLTIKDGPAVTRSGINANNTKVTNVTDGDVNGTSKDAVNGSQLYNVANNVKDLIGPDAAIDPATGKVTVADPTKGIGETGKGNIGDAIKAVNKAATAAKTTVKEGDNITVTPTTNTDGSTTYTVATKKDLDVTSVTAGNTTVNTNGLTITGGPSVTRGGIDAGDRVISGVKAGDVSANSKEAVNGSQLHATNTKLDGVKAKADTAVQDVKSGDENALTAVKDPNTNIVTVTPKLSGDLVDADGNITAPATPADKGKLVTAGTVAQALANTHFVVDTKATDGELDSASQADQKVKAGNKVTLQAGKNLKAKQTNAADGATVEFSLKDSISLTQVTAGTGDNQVVLGNDGVQVGGNTYINKDGLNANSKVISNVADGVNPNDAVNKGQLDAVKGVADSAVKSVDVANGEQNLVVDNTDAKNPKLSLKKDLTLDSVTAGDSTLNTDGLTITGGPSVKKDGINAGDKKIANVAAGDVSATSKDAVNGGQLYNVANNVKDLIGPDATIDPATGKVTVTDPAKGIGETGKGNIGDAIKHVNDAAKAAADTAKKHTTVEQGDNIVVEESTNANGGKHYKVSTAKNLNVDSVKAGDTTVNNDGVTIAGGPSVTKGGINAGGNTITNVADGVNSNDAVNKGQLDAVKNVADSAVKSVDVANGEQNLVVDNSDPKNPKLSLKKDLTVDSVTAGDSTLNNDGLTIAGGPSVKKDGIDAADKKITNVAAGDVAENSKDAVNGGQLYDVAKNVADLVGPDAKIDPATGKVTVTDPAKGIGETGKGNIGDAIKHVNDAAKAAADTAKKHTTVEQGDNIVVEESTNANGGKHYKVSTAKNLNVDSVKAGDTTVNNDGVTINNGPSMTKDGINANNTKVTNVADGVDAADAVNKGQLDKVDTKVSNVAQNVVNVLGGDATVNGNGDITMTNIGETGKGTIGDAIKAVNDLAKKAAVEKTSVKAKDGRSNVTVTEGTNAAGGHEYTVDVERVVTEAGSDQVTVTSKHDADSNTTTYTVDVSDKTKASLAKADSAVQGLTSKDGNLNFNKGPNGNVEVSFNDNLNVKNITTDGVKAGDTTINSNGIEIVNGPSMTKDGINAAGKAISNVANGNVAKGSKDAVNGGQLHETAQSVADVIGGGATVKDGKVVAGQNGIGNTGQNTVHGAIAAINQNTANNFNQIRGDLRKMDRDLRGGIAGALATAGLPQAFRPGKSMVAAAASTYRGQSGLAIGVSRISDNGKVILKVTGNTNSRGDFGGTIGAGYQW